MATDSLIPNIDKIYDKGLNMLVIGLHGCLSGDTRIQANRGGNGRTYTLEHLAYKLNGGLSRWKKTWAPDMETFVRARHDDGLIRRARLGAVTNSGPQKTYTIKTERGYTIKATDNHPFLTENDYLELGALNVGDYVYVDIGKPLPGQKNKKLLYHYTARLAFHPHAALTTRLRHCTHRLVVEANMNNLSLDEYIHILRYDEDVANRLKFLSQKAHVHHKDRNTNNNHLDNLIVLKDNSEHRHLHGIEDTTEERITARTDGDKIISITPFGEEMTYDLTLAEEPHNFVANGFVVHNCGKTTAIQDFAEQRGIRMAYLSAATMDPYTDFVGIPTPRRRCPECREYWPIEVRDCPDCRVHNGPETLLNVRPNNIDDAELLMIDEFNRSQSPKVINAIMELVQFKSINGEKFKHLKCVWAGMNPPDFGSYNVEDIDPAMVDRFDVYVTLDARPSHTYMIEQGCDPQYVKAIISWWVYHEKRRADKDPKNFVSPRRLEKMAHVHAAGLDINLAIPPWQDTDKTKLQFLMDKAETVRGKGLTFGGKLGHGAYSGFDYTPEFIEENIKDVTKYLKNHTNDMDTSRAVAKIISNDDIQIMAPSYYSLIDSLNPAVMEGFFDALNGDRQNDFVKAFEGYRVIYKNDCPYLAQLIERMKLEFEA